MVRSQAVPFSGEYFSFQTRSYKKASGSVRRLPESVRRRPEALKGDTSAAGALTGVKGN